MSNHECDQQYTLNAIEERLSTAESDIGSAGIHGLHDSLHDRVSSLEDALEKLRDNFEDLLKHLRAA